MTDDSGSTQPSQVSVVGGGGESQLFLVRTEFPCLHAISLVLMQAVPESFTLHSDHGSSSHAGQGHGLVSSGLVPVQLELSVILPSREHLISLAWVHVPPFFIHVPHVPVTHPGQEHGMEADGLVSVQASSLTIPPFCVHFTSLVYAQLVPVFSQSFQLPVVHTLG